MRPPAANRNATGVALVIGSAFCFGVLGIFGKLAYRLQLTTPQLLSYRFAGAAVLLWLVARLIHEPLPPRRSLIGLVIMGGAGYVGQSGSYFNALHFIPASTNALLLYTYPVVVTLLAALLFGESLGWAKLAAVALASVGTVFVVEAQVHAAPALGIILGLGSAAFYSAYILYGSRLLPGLPPVSSTATIMTAAALVWGGYAALTQQLAVTWTAPRALLIASFAVIGTTIPVLTFILGLRMVGPSRAAILSTFEPVSTVLLAIIVLGESANPIQYLGGALILVSVVVLEGPGWRASRVLAQAARE
ncbi:MAG: DMT family transporter [Chloroflexi bacterium]|nr:MAG: DMT family transporter [Chloroflexota bacterium]TME47809.1 MAG: DMT family transporter [Chloroflexota bacterium]